MGPKGVALLLSLNLLFFSMTVAQNDDPSRPIIPSDTCPDLNECANNLGLGVGISNECCAAVAGLPTVGGALCFCRAVSSGIFPPLAAEILSQIFSSGCRRNNTIFNFNCGRDQEQNMHV